MCFTHSFFHFATLRKSLQTTSASPYRIYVTDFVSSTDFVSLIYNLADFVSLFAPSKVTDFVSLIYNLKAVF
ncbi:Uncharacterised protein [Streptococcus pneumoniae]|nr:Uncharacterised protein [Streptococcus pneumoniae]